MKPCPKELSQIFHQVWKVFKWLLNTLMFKNVILLCTSHPCYTSGLRFTQLAYHTLYPSGHRKVLKMVNLAPEDTGWLNPQRTMLFCLPQSSHLSINCKLTQPTTCFMQDFFNIFSLILFANFNIKSLLTLFPCLTGNDSKLNKLSFTLICVTNRVAVFKMNLK